MLVGLDEAGAGPGLGSLWAAAVSLRTDDGGFPGLTDSKKMTPKRRQELRDRLLSEGHAYGLGEVTHEEIDAMGMAEARRVVFHRALDDYVSRGGPDPTSLVVDGTIFRPWTHRGTIVPFGRDGAVRVRRVRPREDDARCADPRAVRRAPRARGPVRPAREQGIPHREAHGGTSCARTERVPPTVLSTARTEIFFLVQHMTK